MEMDCKTVHQNLINYQENNLPSGIKKDFEAHVTGCESCKRLVSGFQSVEALIEEAKKVEPDPFMATRIVQFIENELASRQKKRLYMLRPALVTLTTLCAIAVGIAIGKSSSDRINMINQNQNQIEDLKTELYI